MIDSLLSQGDITRPRAAQIAWATYPFDDGVRPESRSFEKQVRSRSWTYLRESKGVGLLLAHDMAVVALEEMEAWAGLYKEPHYAQLYSRLVHGEIPPE